MVKAGKVQDMQIPDARERTMPYLYTLFGFGCWVYLLHAILHAPICVTVAALGGTLSIGLIALINRQWKISAHLTGLGGLIGGILCYCLAVGAIPTYATALFWLCLSWIVMWARLYLDAHTPAQVSAGWLMGLTCTIGLFILIRYVA